MNKARITAVSIAKNEADVLPRFVESIKGLYDRLVIVDTGSTDNTVEVAKSLGAEVHSLPWENDFAKARNRAVELAGTSQWYVMFDCDEVLDGANDLRLRILGVPDICDAVSVDYQTGAGHKFRRTAIWREGKGQWRYRVHEHLIVEGMCVHFPVRLFHPNPVEDHLADQYIEALRLDSEEHRGNATRQYYYGRQLFYGKEMKAISTLLYCSQISRWDGEAGMALVYAGQLALHHRLLKVACGCFRQAVDRAPFLRSAWQGVINTTSRDVKKSEAAKNALEIKEQQFFDDNPRLFDAEGEGWLRSIYNPTILGPCGPSGPCGPRISSS